MCTVSRKTIFINIIVLVTLILVSCTGKPDEDILNQTDQNAVYFESSIGTPIIDAAELNEENVNVVRSYEALQRVLEENPAILVLYLDSNTIEIVEEQWLKDQSQRGVTIVAINTPLSKLGAKLGFVPSMDDRQTENTSETQILISLYQNLRNESSEGVRIISEYFDSFHLASSMIHTLITEPIVRTPYP